MTRPLPDLSANEDLLRRLYDPAYVRRVAIAPSSTPVRVCLDSRMLDMRGTGVATYAQTLARCLPRTGASAMLLRAAEPGSADRTSRTARWRAAMRGTSARPVDGDTSEHDLICADVFREAQVFFDIHGRLMPIASAAPPPVMHWTYPVPLFFEGSRNVYTIHDVIPLRHPDLTPIRMHRHARLLDRISKRAHRLVAVTDAARDEIVATLAIPTDRIVSLSQAIDIPMQRDPALPAGLAAGAYFLCCGTIEPRKNLVAIAQAHARSGSALPLVVVGPDGWRAAEVHRALARMPGVVTMPWQERAMLIAMMRSARAVVLGSLAEGFGLPIAEAMTLGTPVMASALPATSEVAGGAALLVDPQSIDAMADGFARLSTDNRLLADLRERGFARAQHFTVDRYAGRLRDFYDALAAGAVAQDSGA